ncbi:MAG: hypothetical protein GC164_02745 [Phycisphaera sp.]|nr:hypothetical protein [Phycisphaera sp.]
MTRMTPSAIDSWHTHHVDTDSGLQSLREREWVLSNGSGTYAMGTAAGVHQRRYHAYLVAAGHPPVGRIAVLNNVLEQLVLHHSDATQVLQFASLAFRDDRGQTVYAPEGQSMLVSFDKGVDAVWTYRWGKVTFTRRLALAWKGQSAALTYTVQGLDAKAARKAKLRLAPMLTLRDFHSVLKRVDAGWWNQSVAGKKGRITVERNTTHATFSCQSPGGKVDYARSDEWWHNIFYAFDQERGQECLEDHFVPGWFEVTLPTGDPSQEHSVTLTAALGEEPAVVDDAGRWTADRIAHLKPIAQHIIGQLDKSLPKADLTRQARTLAIAADDFVVDRSLKGQKLSTILAGYPWFSDWGRDTFIALPGLLLTTGRFDEALEVLRVFAGSIRNGLVPNRFDDYSEDAAHYNTVDASLWYVHAAVEYVKASGDSKSWDSFLCEACRSIVDAYIRGTDEEIRMAGDGLITAGNPGTQLTWMDAACNGVVFTPRHGKAVEINALWFSALSSLAEMLKSSDKQAAGHYNKLLARIKRSFAKVFWDPGDYLVDHVYTDDQNREHRDTSIRPNQIFVCSLPNSPLPLTKQKLVLAAVEKNLLTPFGLRTLPPDDPHYHPRYTGPAFGRDEAYHQGTVWPWLIGPYAEAVLRVGKFSEPAREKAGQAIASLVEMILGGGRFPALGQLYEIHEAAEPHRPVGCMAQAWSVAEVLRVTALIHS